MEKKIAICIGSDRSNNVRARLSLMLMDGDDVLAEQYHSITVAAVDSLDEVRRRVESHLAQPKEISDIPLAPWPAIPDAEWAKVEAVCAVIQPNRRN